MPKCKNNPSRRYKGTEPSPKGLGYCASGAKGTKKGRDGNMWQIKKYGKSQRWVKCSRDTKRLQPKTPEKRKYSQLAPKECRAQLQVYTKPPLFRKDINGIRHLDQKMRGIAASKDGYIHRVNTCGQLEQDMTKIPRGFKKIKTSEKQRKSFCDTPFDQKGAKARSKAIEWHQWIKDTKKSHLTIAQVLKMKKGQKMKMLMLDRNIGDYVDSQPINKPMAPLTFFKGCWAVYTHSHDMCGTLKFEWEGNQTPPTPFYFHINYSGENWYPLSKDSALPARDPQGVGRLFGFKKSYTQFAPTTRVGYRGPMIPWTTLKSLPKVYKCQWCSPFSALY